MQPDAPEKSPPVVREDGWKANDAERHAPNAIEKNGEPTDDDNIVDWESDDDPQNPMNWTAKQKVFNVSLVILLCLLTPLASSMFAPGVPQVLETFNQSNQGSIAEMVVSIYILGQYQVLPGHSLTRSTNQHRLRGRPTPHKPPERDLWPLARLRRLQYHVYHLHRRLCRGRQHWPADCFSVSGRCIWSLPCHAGWCFHRRFDAPGQARGVDGIVRNGAVVGYV